MLRCESSDWRTTCATTCLRLRQGRSQCADKATADRHLAELETDCADHDHGFLSGPGMAQKDPFPPSPGPTEKRDDEADTALPGLDFHVPAGSGRFA